MGRRYYCDYCDKAFIDDPVSRKKHLNSSLHLNLRKEYYEQNKSASTIMVEELAKQPCRRFLETGFCQFSTQCKYSHFTDSELWNMKETIERNSSRNRSLENFTLSDWHSSKVNTNDEFSWEYLDNLQVYIDLPPSIAKLNHHGFHENCSSDWG